MLTNIELDRLAADTGCEIHDDCLTCPRPSCILDTPKERKLLYTVTLRDEAILCYYTEYCITSGSLAKLFGVNARTIQRALKRGEKDA